MSDPTPVNLADDHYQAVLARLEKTLRDKRVQDEAGGFEKLVGLLKTDYANEKRKLAKVFAEAQGSTELKPYERFDPMLYLLRDLLDGVQDGFGLRPTKLGKKGGLKLSKLSTALAAFATAVYKKVEQKGEADAKEKETERRLTLDMVELFSSHLSGWLRARNKAYERAAPGAKNQRKRDRQQRRTGKAKNKAALIEAVIDFIVTGLTLPGLVAAVQIEKDKTRRQAHWGKVAQAALKMVTAVYQLVSCLCGNSALVEQLLAGLRRQDEANALAALQRKRRLLPLTMADKSAEERQAEDARLQKEIADFDKPATVTAREHAQKGSAAQAGSAVGEVLAGLATLVEKVIAAHAAYRRWRPADPSGGGEWVLSGFKDKLSWTAVIDSAPGKAGVYTGKLVARGLDVVDPKKAPASGCAAEETLGTLEITVEDGAARASFTPAPRKQPLLRTPYLLAAQTGVALTSHSTTRLSGSFQLASPKGQTLSVVLERQTGASQCLEFLTHGVEVFTALFGLIPKAYRDALQGKLDDLLAPLLQKIKNALKFLKYVTLHPSKSKKGYLLELGLNIPGGGVGGQAYKLSATWNLSRIVDAWFSNKAPKPHEPSAYAPCAAAGTIPLPRGFSLSLGWDRLELEKGDKVGGKGIEDSLPADMQALFNQMLYGADTPPAAKDKRWDIDILPPTVDLGGGEKLPSLKMPLVLYLTKVGDYHWNSKLTVTLELSSMLVLQLVPGVRQCLLAWEVGYAVGTLIRQGILLIPGAKAWSDGISESLGNTLYDTRHKRAWVCQGTDLYKLHAKRLLTRLELMVLDYKFLNYHTHHHTERVGVSARLNRRRYDGLVEAIREQIDHLLVARDRQRYADRLPKLRPRRKPKKGQAPVLRIQHYLEGYVLLWALGQAGEGCELIPLLDEAAERGELPRARVHILKAWISGKADSAWLKALEPTMQRDREHVQARFKGHRGQEENLEGALATLEIEHRHCRDLARWNKALSFEKIAQVMGSIWKFDGKTRHARGFSVQAANDGAFYAVVAWDKAYDRPTIRLEAKAAAGTEWTVIHRHVPGDGRRSIEGFGWGSSSTGWQAALVPVVAAAADHVVDIRAVADDEPLPARTVQLDPHSGALVKPRPGYHATLEHTRQRAAYEQFQQKHGPAVRIWAVHYGGWTAALRRNLAQAEELYNELQDFYVGRLSRSKQARSRELCAAIFRSGARALRLAEFLAAGVPRSPLVQPSSKLWHHDRSEPFDQERRRARYFLEHPLRYPHKTHEEKEAVYRVTPESLGFDAAHPASDWKYYSQQPIPDMPSFVPSPE